MERVNMEYEELYKKYLRLLKENEYLKSEVTAQALKK